MMTPPSRDGSFTMRVPKTAELVAGHIRRQIVRGEVDTGDALPSESTLMEEFGISRPTLREAFRILESEGLITIRRGARGGARVQVPSSEVAARYAGLVMQYRGATLADVFEARVIVEAPAARMVAQRRDHVRAARQLQQFLDEHPDPLEPGQFAEFNRLLVSLTNNETLVLLTTMLESITDSATMRYVQRTHAGDERLARRAQRARAKLVSLIEEGDADAAEELWRQYLSEANRALLAEQGGTVIDLLS